MYLTFDSNNFHSLCNKLTESDKEFNTIIARYGYPPMWTRPATFQTLIHIILEQQVSLASALAALNKLKGCINPISPKKLLALSDEELKACYFSRQKTGYVKDLANTLLSRRLSLKRISNLPDVAIREQLKQVQGIGDWTVDVYLLFALQRADIFPVGDLAMINALKEIKKLPVNTSKEEIIGIAEQWRPYRSIATMLLWHYYLSKRVKTALPKSKNVSDIF